MKEDNNIIWIDKSANYIPRIVIGGFVFLGIMGLWERPSIIFAIITLLIILTIYIYYKFFSPETKPLQITKKGLVVTEDKKFPRKRKLIEFKNIKSIRIAGDKKGSRMQFIYISDKSGKKYFNVIFEVNKFKEALGNSLKFNIEDSGLYRFLPKKLR